MARLFVWLQFALPKRLMSDCTGWLARRRAGIVTRLAIRLFVRVFRVDLSDAACPDVAGYETFNAFFTRALDAGARPQPSDGRAVSAAADGTMSELGAIEADRLLQAKGVAYDLTELLGGDRDLAARFRDGRFQTIYLAPYNYHRVHMPLDGRPRLLRYMPGALYSVNAATARMLPRLFCRNERVAVTFERDDGSFALIMVGALNVGSIDLTLPAARPFRNRGATAATPDATIALDGEPMLRGAEFGRFNMGSTVIVLASSGLLEWDPALAPGDTVRVGQTVGRITAPE